MSWFAWILNVTESPHRDKYSKADILKTTSATKPSDKASPWTSTLESPEQPNQCYKEPQLTASVWGTKGEQLWPFSKIMPMPQGPFAFITLSQLIWHLALIQIFLSNILALHPQMFNLNLTRKKKIRHIQNSACLQDHWLGFSRMSASWKFKQNKKARILLLMESKKLWQPNVLLGTWLEVLFKKKKSHKV